MNDRITALEEALEFYADQSAWTQPPVKTRDGLLSIEYENQASKMQRDRGDIARAALAASRAATDCQQPDLVTADRVRIKPLVWDGFVAGSYHIEIEDGGIARLWRYSAEMVKKEEPEYIRGGYLTLVSLDDLKAEAQADHERRVLSSLIIGDAE